MLEKNIKHTISVVVDRLVVKQEIKSRLYESVENCVNLANGLVVVKIDEQEILYSNNYACPDCGWSLQEISPRMFSFNNPYGACDCCSGLGFVNDIDVTRVLKNSHLSIRQGAFNLTGWNYQQGAMAHMFFDALSKKYGINLDIPVKDLPKEHLDILLYGNNGDKIEMTMQSGKFSGSYNNAFEGLVNNLKRRYQESKSEFVRFEIGRFMCEQPCPKCHGYRLNQNALCVKIDEMNIIQMCQKSIDDLLAYFDNANYQEKQVIAQSIIKEIKARLTFLKNVGLGYLTLQRNASTLSGGESQRRRSHPDR